MKDKKLNNLLGLDNFSEEKVLKKSKPTKRTEVAKDVLMENIGKDVNTEKMKGKDVVAVKDLNNLISFTEYSKKDDTKAKKTKRTEVAKDVLESVTGKEVEDEKMKNKDVASTKDLNNLISFTEYSKKDDSGAKKTKRTDVAKDVLEKKKEECDDEKEEKEEEPKKGLTAKQKKLPEGLQKAILKKQK